jgi:hypothetical protein
MLGVSLRDRKLANGEMEKLKLKDRVVTRRDHGSRR